VSEKPVQKDIYRASERLSDLACAIFETEDSDLSVRKLFDR
jgi:hypothetical protein